MEFVSCAQLKQIIEINKRFFSVFLWLFSLIIIWSWEYCHFAQSIVFLMFYSWGDGGHWYTGIIMFFSPVCIQKKVSNALENIIVCIFQFKIDLHQFSNKYHSYMAKFDSCDVKFAADIFIFLQVQSYSFKFTLLAAISITNENNHSTGLSSL